MRPLLGFTRAEITAYARARQLTWREDNSNTSRAFTRNRLRHDVLPALARAVGFDPVPALARSAEIFAAEETWMESLVGPEAESRQLDLRTLRGKPLAEQRRLLRTWLGARTATSVDFATIEAARQLALSGARRPNSICRAGTTCAGGPESCSSRGRRDRNDKRHGR